MYLDSPKSNIESNRSKLIPHMTGRPHRSLSQSDLPVIEKPRHHRPSFYSKAVVNKLVLNVRKSLHHSNKISESSNKQNLTNETPKRVCFAFLLLFLCLNLDINPFIFYIES
jgi:hypothetical protein